MELYKTSIFTGENKYKYNLDEECNIIIKLLDYNNNPVKYKSTRIIVRNIYGGEY